MIQKISFVAVLIIGIVSSIGCKKNKENNILGTWRQMSFMVEDENSIKALWTFQDDDSVLAEVFHADTLLYNKKAAYSIKFKKLSYQLEIQKDSTRFEIVGHDYRGKYVIHELSRDVMTFVCIERYNDNGDWATGGEAYRQVEFVKN